jgi:hypothetical protein
MMRVFKLRSTSGLKKNIQSPGRPRGAGAPGESRKGRATMNTISRDVVEALKLHLQKNPAMVEVVKQKCYDAAVGDRKAEQWTKDNEPWIIAAAEYVEDKGKQLS